MGARTAAVVLRHQNIHGVDRKPGDYLNSDEYNSIPDHVRDAMESSLDIKRIFDAEAVDIFDKFEQRLAALETKFAALES